MCLPASVRSLTTSGQSAIISRLSSLVVTQLVCAAECTPRAFSGALLNQSVSVSDECVKASPARAAI